MFVWINIHDIKACGFQDGAKFFARGEVWDFYTLDRCGFVFSPLFAPGSIS